MVAALHGLWGFWNRLRWNHDAMLGELRVADLPERSPVLPGEGSDDESR
jgi:hypothetical protein